MSAAEATGVVMMTKMVFGGTVRDFGGTVVHVFGVSVVNVGPGTKKLHRELTNIV